MKKIDDDRIVYSLNIHDIQEVAGQVLNRCLNEQEILLVEQSLPGYIDWFQAIENSICEINTEKQAEYR